MVIVFGVGCVVGCVCGCWNWLGRKFGLSCIVWCSGGWMNVLIIGCVIC